MNIKINRSWAMPNKQTFSITPINKIIEIYIKNSDIVIDPFANEMTAISELQKSKSFEYISNDLDPQYKTTFNLEACVFLKNICAKSVDVVLYDPPYSPRQVSECYQSLNMSVNFQTTQSSYWSKQKAEISRITKPGGIVISCGWNSGGIGKKIWV